MHITLIKSINRLYKSNIYILLFLLLYTLFSIYILLYLDCCIERFVFVAGTTEDDEYVLERFFVMY